MPRGRYLLHDLGSRFGAARGKTAMRRSQPQRVPPAGHPGTHAAPLQMLTRRGAENNPRGKTVPPVQSTARVVLKTTRIQTTRSPAMSTADTFTKPDWLTASRAQLRAPECGTRRDPHNGTTINQRTTTLPSACLTRRLVLTAAFNADNTAQLKRIFSFLDNLPA